MAFTDQAALAADSTFGSRIRVAMMTAATQVASEAKGSMDDEVYDKRQQLARQVLTSAGLNTLDMFVWAVVTNVAVTGSSTDSDLQFTVNSVWSGLAGVRVTD